MTQHLSAFRGSPGMPSRDPRFPRNSLVKNTGLHFSMFHMNIGKDYCFSMCDVKCCGTHTPAVISLCSLPKRTSKRHRYTGSKFV